MKFQTHFKNGFMVGGETGENPGLWFLAEGCGWLPKFSSVA
jgi:hypothetical protein